MSTIIQIPGTLQRPAALLLSTTGLTSIYTASDNADTVVSILIANDDNAAREGRVYWFDGTTDNLILAKSFAAIDSYQFDQPVRLYSGNIIKAQASVANAIWVTVITTKTPRFTTGA